jgi:hypothetical protein
MFSHYFFLGAALLFTSSAVAAASRFSKAACVLLAGGLTANAVSMAVRYMDAWPMLPLYQGPFFLSFAMGVVSLRHLLKTGSEGLPRIGLIAAISVAVLFFPKDYYLPFFKSNTAFSHFFFLFGVAAKACFLIASVEAGMLFLHRRREKELPWNRYAAVGGWITWGFAFLTLSMFAGEMWAYLGWGCPIVWEDSSIAVAMASWCFYTCFLHLHLSRRWTISGRLGFAAAGGPLMLFFTFYTELGPFQWPHLR